MKVRDTDNEETFKAGLLHYMTLGWGWPSGLRHHYSLSSRKKWTGTDSNLGRPKKALIPSHPPLSRDKALAVYSESCHDVTNFREGFMQVEEERSKGYSDNNHDLEHKLWIHHTRDCGFATGFYGWFVTMSACQASPLDFYVYIDGGDSIFFF